jgi:hypothetical protein
MLHIGSLFALHFNLEDGGDMFLRNIDWRSNYYAGVRSQKTELFITTAVITSNYFSEDLKCMKNVWCSTTMILFAFSAKPFSIRKKMANSRRVRLV